MKKIKLIIIAMILISITVLGVGWSSKHKCNIDITKNPIAYIKPWDSPLKYAHATVCYYKTFTDKVLDLESE